jgi:hypothetical protein
MTEHGKFYFSDRVTLDRLTKLDGFFRDLKDSTGLEGCIIGGVAVAANHINKVFSEYNIKDKKYSNKIKEFSRPTSDIDIVIDGEKPNNFYDLILQYFGTAN